MAGINNTLAGKFGGVHTVTPITILGSPAIPTPGSAGWGIPIAAPVPPTLTLGAAQGVLAAASGGSSDAGAYVASTVASANSGHPLGVANAEVLTLAQRLDILGRFTAQYVSADAAAQVRSGLHLVR